MPSPPPRRGLFFHLHFLPGPADHRLGLASWRKGAPYLREISYALGSILPAGGNTALDLSEGSGASILSDVLHHHLRSITLWTASGVMISWMDGFRRCYELPKTWGLVQERLIAFLLVVFALIPMTFATLLVAVGSKFETRLAPLPRSRLQRLCPAACGAACAGSSRP